MENHAAEEIRNNERNQTEHRVTHRHAALGEDDHRHGRAQNADQTDRDQILPADCHQLVDTYPGQRRTNPHGHEDPEVGLEEDRQELSDGQQDDAFCSEYDADGDGRVDGTDLAWIGRAFGSCSGNPASQWWYPVDANRDGCVGGDDLALFSTAWNCRGQENLCD